MDFSSGFDIRFFDAEWLFREGRIVVIRTAFFRAIRQYIRSGEKRRRTGL